MNTTIKAGLKAVGDRLGLVKYELRNQQALSKFRIKIGVRQTVQGADVWVIGCGRMGSQFVKSIKGFPLIKIVGLTDYYVENANNLLLTHKLDCRVTKDFKDIDVEFNRNAGIVIIATTANSHFEILSWLLENGFKKIIVEKPLACSLNQGKELLRLAEAYKALVSVDHSRRWMPCYQGLRSILDARLVGEVLKCYFIFGEAGYAMIGSHFFDLLSMLFNATVRELRAVNDQYIKQNKRGKEFTDPTGVIFGSLTNDVSFFIDISNSMKEKKQHMLFIGETGRIEVDVNNQFIQVYCDNGISWSERFPYSVDKSEALINAIVDMSNSEQPRCSLLDGYNAIEGVIASILSNEQNTFVKLPLTGSITERVFNFA